MKLADKFVIKHSSAVQITNKINLLQRRAWNILLANAYETLLDKDEYSVKIRELMDSDNKAHDFSKTKNEMLFSIKEQIVLIFLSLILLMINDSKWLTSHPKLVSLMKMSVLTCFTYAMVILSDAAQSIFVVLSFKKND